ASARRRRFRPRRVGLLYPRLRQRLDLALGNGRADDHRPDELRCLRQLAVLDPGDREPRRLDGVEGRAVALATEEEAVDGADPILQARDLRVVRAHMLDEQQTATGTEYATDLAKGPGLVVDPAEHERRDDGVEAVVLERKVLGGSGQDLDESRLIARLLFQPPQHRLIGLGRYERPDTLVVCKVRAGAGADLEHVPAGLGEQPVAHLPQTCVLTTPGHRVVDRRED